MFREMPDAQDCLSTGQKSSSQVQTGLDAHLSGGGRPGSQRRCAFSSDSGTSFTGDDLGGFSGATVC